VSSIPSLLVCSVLACLVCAGLTAPAQASPKVAVVNAGSAELETARRLLRLYEALEPPAAQAPQARPRRPATPPPTRKAARPAPRVAARPTAREAARPSTREAARPAPRQPARPAPREAARRAAARPRETARPRAAARPRETARPRAAGGAGLGLAPVKGRALRRALLGLPHDESLPLARRAVARGKRLFTSLKRAAAVDAFTGAIDLLDRQVRWKRAEPLLVQAHTYLLLCHHALGAARAAQAVANRLRELSEGKRPAGVPAPVWKAYPLQPTALTPRHELRIQVPAKARVYLDDHLAGTGPQTLHVGPGAHRVRVERPGHRVYFQRVTPSASMKLAVTLVPEPEDAYADVREALDEVRRSGAPFDPAPYRRLGKTLFVDYLLVAVPDGKRVRLRWFSRQLGRFATEPVAVALPPAPAAPGAGSAAGGSATGGSATARLRAALRATFGTVRSAERTDAALASKAADQGRRAKAVNGDSKIWKKWYFWVAAVAVAGLVAGFAIADSLEEEKVILKITRP
jgi:hypothetical protein